MVRNSQRPTVPPARDVAKHARYVEEARALPEARPVDVLDEPVDTHPTSETRLATRPEIPAVNDETWARSMIGMPVPAVAPAELRLLPLDPRAAFLLSQMDGRTDLDTVLELAAMPRANALRLVRELFVSGIVDFKYR
jgi:hypothetical protein